jgi:hypothetical protein
MYYEIEYADRIYFSYYVHERKVWLKIFKFKVFYFFTKHKTSKTYSEVTVRILVSSNFCLEDSRF